VNLYLPEKYPVLKGQGKGLGFCTVWSDPEHLLQKTPELKQKVQLIGTLYSPEGVNIMLRNLALNPDITKLIIWSKGELSQTAYGNRGVKILKNLWDKKGLKDVNFDLHSEFDKQVLKKIINNVDLIDFSDLELEDAVEKVSQLKPEDKYMDSQSFKEHKPKSGQVYPSEQTGFLVRGTSVVNTWLRAVSNVMRFGLVKKTEYGNKMRELGQLNWVIEQGDISNPKIPDWPKKVLDQIGLKQESMEEYFDEFLSSNLPEGTVYTYGQRLRSYPNKEIAFDQVEEIIDHLNRVPYTRRAVGTTLYPPIDKQASSPPCINQVQFLLIDEKLTMFVLARSHDLFKAAIPNAYGLLALQDYVCKETDCKPGPLSISSISAHIYEEDWEDALDLIECQRWGRDPELGFDAMHTGDPRGNVLVRVENKDIVVTHVSPSGKPLKEYRQDGTKPKAALKLAKKLERDQVISRIGHALDIGEQLGRAEDAVKLGKEFKQDRELKVDNKKNG
jgi:thymidylate synthase